MAKRGLSPFDADILRTAFHKAVKDESTPESKWRELAAQLIATYTGSSTVDPDLVEWIVQSESHQ
ncbi:hypothetical protein FJ414_21365 [Mesorhizobium sp. B3-1-6]|uniref:hypothetical protein n=1 Tax=unclassified Mesorhizobium TaxID=325217 RepID=UPI0011299E69|nr:MULTISPECIES: hypothetical protein [unclassified Mesorhizobium]TPI32627.1 hypothetical protein FJ414_21365 [Mesorhizobium sp. B3-1-6]TPJ36982.1 hypothetical protein FJ418_01500 [Mesorhizobium sp. B2-8-3]UCI28219.1 hypothetical protein FJ430_11725 [Mesorhizobium sp. B2-8-5]